MHAFPLSWMAMPFYGSPWAINLYLAQKYEGPMHCAEPKVLGLAAQWSFWAMLEMEGLLLDLLQHRALLPEFARDASYAERDELLLRKPLEVLNNSAGNPGAEIPRGRGQSVLASAA